VENPELDAKAAAFSAAVRDQLRRACERRGLTRGELRAEVGEIADKILTGASDLDIAELQRVCPMLGLDLREVIREAYRITERDSGGNSP